MFSKDRLLDVLRFAHQQEMAFIDRLTDEQRAASGAADNWTAKDHIAHLSTWKTRLLDRLEAAVRGERLPADERSDDEINAEIYAAHRDKSWDEVRQMAEDAYRRVTEYVRAAPEHHLTAAEFSVHEDDRAPWQALVAEYVSHAMVHLWDYHFHHGEPARAVTLQEATTAQMRELDDPRAAGTAMYNLACVYARTGRTQDAIRALEEGLRLRPDLIEWSKEDSDLDPLRGEPSFQALYRAG